MKGVQKEDKGDTRRKGIGEIEEEKESKTKSGALFAPASQSGARKERKGKGEEARGDWGRVKKVEKDPQNREGVIAKGEKKAEQSGKKCRIELGRKRHAHAQRKRREKKPPLTPAAFSV